MKSKIILISTLLVLILVAFSGCTQRTQDTASPDAGPVKEGLSEEQKKEIYYNLVEYQDSIPFSDPDYGNRQQEAYVIIADRYGVEESEVRKIVSEGIEKDWPMPPPPKN